jgi:hypothetical protein
MSFKKAARRSSGDDRTVSVVPRRPEGELLSGEPLDDRGTHRVAPDVHGRAHAIEDPVDGEAA